MRADALGKEGDHFGVDGVGLGELAERAGEVSDLARIDDGERQAGAGESGGDRGLEAASGFQHDQRHVERRKTFDETFQSFAVTRDGKGLVRRAQMHIETILGHINTDADCDAARLVHDPSLQMRARSALATVRAFGQSDGGRAMLTRGLYDPEGDRANLRP